MGNWNGGVTGLDQGDREREGTELEEGDRKVMGSEGDRSGDD